MKDIVLKPRMSEKAYGVSQERNVYVFDVPVGLNKHGIAGAVAAQFDVTVERVNVTNVKGKAKRTIAKKGRVVHTGRNVAVKKAYVTLKKGDALPFFAAVEEAEEKQQETQERVAKAMEKQAAKETKKEAKPARRGLHLPGRRSGSRGGDK